MIDHRIKFQSAGAVVAPQRRLDLELTRPLNYSFYEHAARQRPQAASCACPYLTDMLNVNHAFMGHALKFHANLNPRVLLKYIFFCPVET